MTISTPSTGTQTLPGASAEAGPPDIGAVQAARRRLAGQAVVTPLLEAPELSERAGARVLLKAETLQRTGSFKFRGAFNRIASLPPEVRARGVVAYSSGNHAQGVAAAARLFGIPAVIVMPADAPAVKIANTRGYGAEVRLYERYREDREAIGAQLQAERGLALVKPYDDPFVVAGQGTVGLELAEQAAAIEARLDRVLVCCGGGGLTAGIALALEHASPDTHVQTCEPDGFDDTARSLAAGERLANAPGGRSICDALLSPTPGSLTFPILKRRGVTGLSVDDAEVRAAMAYAFRRLKLVVEPGGAVCLAAILAGKADIRPGETLALTLSGGNVDPETLREALAANPED